MDLETQRQGWLRQLPSGQFRHLFDHLPGALFFAKDREGRMMAGNPAFVRRCGFESEEELVGLSDERIFPPRLAAKYRRDDERVMETARPMLGAVELFPNAEGKP
jgi:PAS domain S-box-containing protein